MILIYLMLHPRLSSQAFDKPLSAPDDRKTRDKKDDALDLDPDEDDVIFETSFVNLKLNP